MIPLIVSYWAGEHYRILAEQLRASIKCLSYDYDIRELPDQGDWRANCALKPTFLRDMLDEHDRGILWVDADAELVAPLPVFWETGDDVMFGKPPWRWVSTGTIYVNNTPRARQLLEDWITAQAERPDVTDEEALRPLLIKPKAKVGFVPPSCLYIFDIWAARFPRVKPVIMHKQASRLAPEMVLRNKGKHSPIHPDVEKAFYP